MADKPTKRGPRAKRETPSVLGNLPATRPQRLGRPRTDTAAVSEAPKPAAAKAKAAAPKRRTTQTGARRKPQPAAATSAESARRRSTSHEASRIGPPRRPTAVRPGARPLEPPPRAGEPPPARTVQAPRGTELVTTTIQAVGELAQFGLSVSGRALKRAVKRLPRP